MRKTKRGKRGGKKHAAEAEQKSAERQRKLPGRHSLDALVHTAAETGRQLSDLRHFVISEALPTPKVNPITSDLEGSLLPLTIINTCGLAWAVQL